MPRIERRAAAPPPEPQLAQLLFTQLIKPTQKRCHMELKARWYLRNVHRLRLQAFLPSGLRRHLAKLASQFSFEKKENLFLSVTLQR